VKTLTATILPGFAALIAAGMTAEAQFTCTTNNGAITITGYTGSGGAVTIPNVIDDLPVTDIGTNAFADCSVTSVTIPNSVTSFFSDPQWTNYSGRFYRLRSQ
jgi:hypothetical protein